MAQVQMPSVVRPARAPHATAILLGVVGIVLVTAIAFAMAASGVFTRGPVVNPGDFGTTEWNTFRAGERDPLFAPGRSQVDMGPRARAESELSAAGIHGSLAGTSAGSIDAGGASAADPLLSATSIDLRRCERDGC